MPIWRRSRPGKRVSPIARLQQRLKDAELDEKNNAAQCDTLAFRRERCNQRRSGRRALLAAGQQLAQLALRGQHFVGEIHHGEVAIKGRASHRRLDVAIGER